MATAVTLEIPYLPVTDRAFEIDPIPYLAAARAEHPWVATCDFGYFIHGYQAIKDIMMMEASRSILENIFNVCQVSLCVPRPSPSVCGLINSSFLNSNKYYNALLNRRCSCQFSVTL